MTGLTSQLAPHPGRKSQEIVTDETDRRATQPARIDYSITHALPGRVGFCVPRIAEDPEYVQRLEALLTVERWVTSEQVNSAAASVVITYKCGVIPDAEMRSHLASLIQSANDLEQGSRGAGEPSKIAYSIAHAIPGRIRFRVPRIAQDPEYVKRLEALLAEDSWITSERVNTAAASIVMIYKTGVMLDSEMRSHLASLIQSASDAVAAKGKGSGVNKRDRLII